MDDILWGGFHEHYCNIRKRAFSKQFPHVHDAVYLGAEEPLRTDDIVWADDLYGAVFALGNIVFLRFDG